MPIALTNKRVIYRQFTAATRSDMVEAVNATMQAVGWVSVAVTGGYRLQGASPQGLNIYLYVRDLGHEYFDNPNFIPQVTFNFSSLDGLYIGADHEIAVGFDTYQIVTGCCYLWLSVVGMAFSGFSSQICGGIPFVPDASACGGEIPATSTNECFWAMGDGFEDLGPRSSLLTNGSMSQSEALWNTDYCAPGNPAGSPRFACATWASTAFGAFDVPSKILWRNGADFELEPMLCWGTTNAAIPQLRAQAYDCMIFTLPVEMDSRQTRGGLNYVAFTNMYLYGCLHLIVPTSSFVEGNYAYIAT